MLTFLKNRLILIVILLVSLIFIPLNIKARIYIATASFLSLLFHDFLHESGHAIAAAMLGFKITWFSVNEVHFDGEPSSSEDIMNSSNRLRYGIIAISGSAETILCGYMLLFIAHGLRQDISLTAFISWIFTLIIFLLGDCFYLIIGSISMNGDPIGISAGFNVSKWIVFCFGITVAAINTFLIYHYFWVTL